MDFIRRFVVVVCGSVCVVAGSADAQVNSWTNPLSARWESNYWSLGTLPGANQSVFITNSGFKAVGVFSSTVSNAPASLTVSNLTIGAPSSAFSTLLLNFIGTNVPLRVLSGCEVSTNGNLINDFSALEIDGRNGGQFKISGGTFTGDGATLIVSNDTHVSGGILQLTNSVANFSRVYVEFGGATTGQVIQVGGAVNGEFLIKAGAYQFTSGTVTGRVTVGYDGTGQMTQDGGTNFGVVVVGISDTHDFAYGTYVLSGGAIVTEGIGIAVSSGFPTGNFFQGGGYVQTSDLALGFSGFSHGSYTISAGVLNAARFELWNSSFNQSGGQVTFGSPVSVSGSFDDYNPEFRTSSFFSLGGGVLTMPKLHVSLFGSFGQSGGSNIVGNVAIDRTGYSLSGGVLNATNVFIAGGFLVLSDGSVRTVGEIQQTGGTNYVANLLGVGDKYELLGGLLYAGNISVSGNSIITGTMIVSNNASVINPGTFSLGGVLQLLGTTQNFGALILLNNSVMDFSANASTARFSPSSTLPWAPGSALLVTNWHGSTNGGGASRLIVGTNGNGLNGAQLAQIGFVNPGGLAAGTYGARILTTGEVVPTLISPLGMARIGPQIILTWFGALTLQSATNVNGPYLDVPTATSPFTNSLPAFPQRFFRLRL